MASVAKYGQPTRRLHPSAVGLEEHQLQLGEALADAAREQERHRGHHVDRIGDRLGEQHVVDVHVGRAPGVTAGRTSIAQRKLSARSMLPLPAYCATCGYGHNGIVRSIPVSEVCNAVMRAGARAFRWY